MPTLDIFFKSLSTPQPSAEDFELLDENIVGITETASSRVDFSGPPEWPPLNEENIDLIIRKISAQENLNELDFKN
ncbi:hypothetical protein PR048_023619 [Dryococelus australis]|uniref:Uncharacterized protein n=1 Tax=Dryococelus australis TaxID=614101 RepID=A0ABQ9GUL4_9NEOP|nr:hypothetical protein PR048_023619 [Dryococelus australis]